MAIISFTPTVGPNANLDFPLPPIKQDVGAEIHVLTLADTAEPMDHGDGSIFAEGTDATYREHGTITCTFVVSDAWLSDRRAAGVGAYTSNGAGILTFNVDFAQSVIAGGLGQLLDSFEGAETGMHLGAGGAVQDFRTCTARVVGDVTFNPVSYTQGVPYQEIIVTFKCPQGGWTYQPSGVFVPWH